MEIPQAKGYSIWLLFNQKNEKEFQAIIDQLSTQFNSPKFIPHITLLSGLDGSETELIIKLEQLSQLKSFRVKSEKVSYVDEFYRSLFIEIKKSEELKTIFELATKVFNIKSDFNNFLPHISLLYSFEKSEIKKRLIKEYLLNLSEEIKVSRIGLCLTKGKPEDWRIKKIIKLK
jgi:2'-5' RNA ligase